MNLYVGTSGYSYKEWIPAFYPPGTKAAEMLACYGTQFRCVEINNTFHRMPNPEVLESWAAQVPSEFRFVLKAPQSITHMRRLKNAEDSVAFLLRTASSLRMRLGPILFQLPPQMKKDAERLAGFLKLFASDQRVAFEFRHESWFDDEVYEILRSANAAMCLAEADDDLEVPFVSTADWGYLRLRRADYDEESLAAKAKQVLDQSWGDAFVFFKHEDEAKGPKLASRFCELAQQKPHKARKRA